MKHNYYLNLFSLFVLLAITSCKESNAESTQLANGLSNDSLKMITALPERLVPKDQSFNQIAAFLGGIKQKDSSLFTQFENKDFWMRHASEMEIIWEKATDLRLNKISSWTDTTFLKIVNDSLPLFYPFAGGDFLHAKAFYPNASEYHLVAREKMSLLPDFTAMDDKELSAYLANLRNSLRDVIGKSYFITKHMISDLKSGSFEGLMPLYYVFLARTGYEILNIEPIRFDTQGIHVHDSVQYAGVRMQITPDGFRQQILTYMNFDLGDNNIRSSGYFKDWVNSLGEKNVFLKAASYLPHYNTFKEIRILMFDNTSTIFQDDSGIAFRYVDTTKFDVKLFGRYTRPIACFDDHTFQKDLAALYGRTPSSEIPEIPFSLGYHVVGDKIQNHQIFIRKN